MKVGDLVTLQRGTTYEGSLVGAPGPALLGLGSIDPGGGFRAIHYKTFGGECPPKIMVDPGELYVALKGATKDGSMVGSVARVPPWLAGGGRLTQDTARLDFTEKGRGLEDYLYWVLRTPQYRSYCAGRLTGSASASFSREDFLAYAIPAPDPFRTRVVDALGALDEKVQLNRRMDATEEAALGAVFRAWFLADDATRSWPASPFDEHIEVTRGLSYTGDGLALAGIPLHNLHSIRTGGGYSADGIKWYKGDFRERHVVRAGDVVVANTDLSRDRLLIGHAAVIPSDFGPDGLYSHHLYRVRVRPDSTLTPDFVCYLLNSREMHEVVSGYSNGTTVQMLPAEALQRPAIAVPPAKAVRRFSSLASLIRERQQARRREGVLLASVRAALLARLLPGGPAVST